MEIFTTIASEVGKIITEVPAEIPSDKLKETETLEKFKKNTSVNEIKTIRNDLEGQKHPETGVEYVRKEISLPDEERIEGVFPEFDSVFDVEISEDKYLDSDGRQFRECNNQLGEALKENPELANNFTDEQLDQIFRGRTPDGYVWHHSEEPGVLKLVDKEVHEATRHTGGRSIWGGGQEFR